MKKRGVLRLLVVVAWIFAVFYIIYVSFTALESVFPKIGLSNIFKQGKYQDVKNVVNQKLVIEESATIDVVENVSPAVVSIVVKSVTFDLFTGPELVEAGIGTGFIIDSSGLIVTNSHVVSSRGEYSVVLKDGTTYDVEKIHRDSFSDLALIEITARNLPVANLGDSDILRVGQKAIAIGNALGRFQNTVTVGVVSGIGRNVVTSGGFGTRSVVQENAIQTDAALNPGNSGGPLLNSAGQVIGINVATTIGADNISFAIPVNTLKPILEVFLKEGKIVRPYMGITYSMISPEIANLRNMPEGAYVTAVMSDSPADKAGLVRSDIITEFNSEPVTVEFSIARAISKYRVGDKVNLKIDRNGETLDIEVTLGVAPEEF